MTEMASVGLRFGLDPTLDLQLGLYAFTRVANCDDLLRMAKEETLACALINPDVVCDPFQVVVAANRAALAQRDGRLITRSVHSQILFELSPSKNISKSLSVFGIPSDRTPKPNLLVAIIHESSDSTAVEKVLSHISGESCSFASVCGSLYSSNIRNVFNVKSHTSDDLIRKIITAGAVK